MNDGQPGFRPRRRHLLVGTAAAATGVSATAILPTLGSAAGTAPGVRMDAAEFLKFPSRVAALEGAVKEMIDRSTANASDPRGWLVNAKMHADFCSLEQTAVQQIHFCWWFLPWHRAYLHVTERKLREISGDTSLSLPYWN